MNIGQIERKWQKRWERSKVFEANVNKKRKKFFITFPYPYVNGACHIGAAFTAFRVDAYARFKRMQGFNVLYPQGFHATGEPIVGAVERLKQGDENQKETFKLFGASERDIKDFIKFGAQFVARYWMKKWIEILKTAGFSIDWRRTFITTAMTPTYSRFIEWQYNTLRKKGYVIQGTHPVIWCPHCQSPTGDHDRLKGEGESPIEFTILKFKFRDMYLCAATLRPETVFGQTNMWVNPEIEYAVILVDDKEKWVVSKECAEKLKDQLKKVKIVGSVRGKEMIGKYCIAPVINKDIIILPAKFCDPNVGTGLVTSVPSHAPFDWQALEDLKNNHSELSKYGINHEVIKRLKPISIIKVEGFGEHPSKDVIEKLGIKSQEDYEKLKRALHTIYTKEHHAGIMKDNCGEYSGTPVETAKDKIKMQLIDEGLADIVWEPTDQVVCRCKTINHVKILENQWFLKFSDENWKNKVKKCISQMKFYPEDARTQFLNTVDWLKDKACARKTGLGTNLPWDKEWIVETLSDSTIYMAYYTLARIMNQKKIEAEKLTDEVFDHVFLGIGDLSKVSKISGLDGGVISGMRNEFEYFYPVDLRNSGKDLVQNHLTFFLFHHVAIWDNPKYWPRAIGVNGYVKVAGTKMSKSKGNIIPLKNLVESVGADFARINIIASNEGLNDAAWEDENLSGYDNRIKFLYGLVSNFKKAKRKNEENIDLFLKGRVQEHIKNTTQSFEEMKFRSGAQSALFDFTNDLDWCIERSGGVENCNRTVLKDALDAITKLVSPLIPHLAEEFWGKLGNKRFVSITEWPKPEKISTKPVEMENILRNTLEDLKQINKIAGKKENAYLYVFSDGELNCFLQAKKFLNKKFRFKKLEICLASDSKKYDPQNKSQKAKYGKPGIYLE